MRTWTNRIVFLVGLAVVLPGGRGIVGEEPQPAPRHLLQGVGVNSDAGVTGTIVLDEPTAEPAAPETHPWKSKTSHSPSPYATEPLTVTYKSDDLIGFLKKHDLHGPQAHRQLELLIEQALATLQPQPRLPQPRPVPRPLDVDSQPGWLVVTAPPADHKRLERELKLVRAAGGWFTAQIETQILFGFDEESVEDLSWQVVGPLGQEAASEEMRPLKSHQGTVVSTRQSRHPMSLATISEEQFQKLIQKWQGDSRTNLIAAPKVRVFNGQQATVQSETQRPFVIGVHGGQPHIEVVREGWSCQFLPTIDRESLTMEMDLGSRTITGVEVVQIGKGDSRHAVQVPTLFSSRARLKTQFRPGEVTLVNGLSMPDSDGKTQPLLFAVRATRMPMELAAVQSGGPAARPSPDKNSTQVILPRRRAAIQSSQRGTTRGAERTKYGEDPRREDPLGKVVDLQFDNTSLGEALRAISREANTNIVADARGLKEAGISLDDEVVPLEVSGITARSLLRILLEPLGLTTTVTDEVVLVTSKDRAFPLLVKTYAVADLVIPIPTGESIDDEEQSQAEPKTASLKADAKPLISLIQQSIDPDSWSEQGGHGSVVFHEATLSLVVRQREDAHRQIAELFDELRRLQDVQVALDLQQWQVPRKNAEQLSLSAETRFSPARAKDATLQPRRIISLPKPTLFNGQQCNVTLEDGQVLSLLPVVSTDRRNVRLTIIDRDDQSAGSIVSTVRLDDGQRGFYLLRTGDDSMTILRITPRILVTEEEEERLPLPETGEARALWDGKPGAVLIVEPFPGRRIVRMLPRQTDSEPATNFRIEIDGRDGLPGVEATGKLEFGNEPAESAKPLRKDPVPFRLTSEDVEQLAGGNGIVKVVYVSDAHLTSDGVHAPSQEQSLETIVSTRLDPSADAVEEAQRRGKVIAILRLSPEKGKPSPATP